MADVLAIPDKASGHVPMPALVAPLEFAPPRADLSAALGGQVGQAPGLETRLIQYGQSATHEDFPAGNPWPGAPG